MTFLSRMVEELFDPGGEGEPVEATHTEYRDKDGYNVFVLETGEAEGWVAPWWTWLVLGVLALVLLTCCARATMRMAGFLKEDRPAKLAAVSYRECQICRRQVAGPRWAEHRRECYMRHAVVLSKLPACDIKVDTKLQCAPCYCVPQCPTCRVRLKLWQLNIGEQSFTCADTGHGCAQYGGYTTNTGRNWYTCHKCSFDLCLQCVQKRLDRVSRLCWLCGSRVSLETWRAGHHRRACALQHQAALATLPASQDRCCPRCAGPLLVWPATAQPYFLCLHPGHRGRPNKEIRNTGANQLSCYTCDYSVCMKCVNTSTAPSSAKVERVDERSKGASKRRVEGRHRRRRRGAGLDHPGPPQSSPALQPAISNCNTFPRAVSSPAPARPATSSLPRPAKPERKPTGYVSPAASLRKNSKMDNFREKYKAIRDLESLPEILNISSPNNLLFGSRTSKTRSNV